MTNSLFKLRHMDNTNIFYIAWNNNTPILLNVWSVMATTTIMLYILYTCRSNRRAFIYGKESTGMEKWALRDKIYRILTL